MTIRYQANMPARLMGNPHEIFCRAADIGTQIATHRVK